MAARVGRGRIYGRGGSPRQRQENPQGLPTLQEDLRALPLLLCVGHVANRKLPRLVLPVSIAGGRRGRHGGRVTWRDDGWLSRPPYGLEICGAPLWGSRPASQDQYRAKAKHPAGPVGRRSSALSGYFAFYALRRTGSGAGRQGREAKRRRPDRVVGQRERARVAGLNLGHGRSGIRSCCLRYRDWRTPG